MRWRRVAVAVAVAVLILGVGLFSIRRSLTDAMLFFPAKGQWRKPSALGLPYEHVWLEAKDGTRTQAWWMPGNHGEPIVVMFHGNAGTISDRLENAKLLHDLGLTVMLPEYRGYGDSEGKPSEEGLYLDARAALAEARRRAPGWPVIVFGRSLGAAVAIDLAAAESVEGLVAESAFTSLKRVAGKALKVPFASLFTAYEFDSLSKIPRVDAPALVIHGEEDELIPFSMGEQLFEATRDAPWRRFHAVPGGDHNGTFDAGGEPYWEAWRALLDEVRRRGTTHPEAQGED